MTAARRGEVWLADLNPTRGHEQAGQRPVVIVSDDLFNHGPAGLVIVLPVTSTIRAIPSHVVVNPPEGGLRNRSAIMCEVVRSISVERLRTRIGRLRPASMAVVEDGLRILMRL